MKRTKRTLSLLLVLLLCLSLLPVGVLAASETSAEIIAAEEPAAAAEEPAEAEEPTEVEESAEAEEPAETEGTIEAEEVVETTETVEEEAVEAEESAEVEEPAEEEKPTETEESAEAEEPVETEMSGEVSGAIDAEAPAMGLDPSFRLSAVLAFDETDYSGAVGENVAITATYVCEQEPTEFLWECEDEAVSFGSTSVQGPAVTGEENTYWLSVQATGVTEGTHNITLTVKSDFAQSVSAQINFTVTEAVSRRYTVLILDTSGSMDETPADIQKEAAIKFCTAVTSASRNDYIAIVKLNSRSSVVCDFTSDLDTLTNGVEGISTTANGGTNMNAALAAAQELLDEIPDSAGTTKNIVLCSDGLPQTGSTTSDGPYTSSDHSDYAYGNAVYNTAAAIKESGITLYTLGFFHELSGTDLTFGQRLLKGIATSADCYSEVNDAEDEKVLENVFLDIAEAITDPVSIEISTKNGHRSGGFSASGSLTESTVYFTCEITATITNNSKTTDLTNVYAYINEGESDEVVVTLDEAGEWKQTAASLSAGESVDFSWSLQLDITNYTDGGVYTVTVYAGSDQTVKSSAQGDIVISAANGESNELDFSCDVWNFHNYVDNDFRVHEMTDNDYDLLMTVVSPSERGEILDNYLTDGGHCYGMSLTVILSKMNIFNISEYSDFTSLGQAAERTERITSILCYYQLLCHLDSRNDAVDSFNIKNTKEKLAILSEKADEVKNGGSPVMLELCGKDGWCHAVVAYATETRESDGWPVGEKTYYKRVLIYDCNAATWNENYCLYFDDETGEWIIPEYKDNGVTSECENGEIQWISNDLQILNTQNYDSSLYNYVAYLRAQNETAMRLANSSSEYIIQSGSVTGDTELTTYSDPEGSGGSPNIVLPDEEDDYTLSTLSGGAEALDFYLKDEDLFLSVEANAANGSAFSIRKNLSLLGNEGSYTLKLADDDIAAGELDTFTVSGENQGDITVQITDDGLLITGDDLTDITVTGSDEDSEADVTFSTKYDSALVVPSEDNSKLIVLVDTDNDEVYETIISGNGQGGSSSSTAPASPTSPPTGDEANIALYVVLALVSVTGLAMLAVRKRKASK